MRWVVFMCIFLVLLGIGNAQEIEWTNGTIEYDYETLNKSNGFLELTSVCVGYINETQANNSEQWAGILLVQTIELSNIATNNSSNHFELVLFDSEKSSYYSWLNNTIYTRKSSCNDFYKYSQFNTSIDWISGISRNLIFVGDYYYPRHWWLFMANCHYSDLLQNRSNETSKYQIEYSVGLVRNPNATTMINGDDYCDHSGSSSNNPSFFESSAAWYVIVVVIIVAIIAAAIGFVLHVKARNKNKAKYELYQNENDNEDDD